MRNILSNISSSLRHLCFYLFPWNLTFQLLWCWRPSSLYWTHERSGSEWLARGERRENPAHYLSPPLHSHNFHATTRGEEEMRHSQANCPLAYRHFGKDFNNCGGRERAKVPGSKWVFESLAGVCQQVAGREAWWHSMQRKEWAKEEKRWKPLRVSYMLNLSHW